MTEIPDSPAGIDDDKPNLSDLDQRLLNFAFEYIGNGMINALLAQGAPIVLAQAFAAHHVNRMRNDPIARTCLLDDARLVWDGRENERKPMLLPMAGGCSCGEDYGSKDGDS